MANKRTLMLAVPLLAMPMSPLAAQAVGPTPTVTPATAPIGAPLEREARMSPDESRSMRPIGAHFGAFTFLPKAEVALTYDDNIYALENKSDDVVYRISPSFQLKADAKPYQMTISGSLDRLEYDKNKREARTDYHIDGQHSYEIAPSTPINANLGFSRLHEDRGDPNATTTNLSPTLYKRFDAGVGISRDLARLSAGLRGTYNYYNFYDARQIGGGITNNDDRDRYEATAEGRLGYEFSPGYSLLGLVSYTDVNYRLRLDDGGFNRSSEELRASLGVKFEVTRILTGQATVGYLRRKYKDVRFDTSGRFAFDSAITWYATELTSVRLTARRSIEETVAPGYKNFQADSFSVRVEHELTRSIKLTGTARYIDNRYLVSSGAVVPDRREKFYGGAAGVRYNINRNLYAVAGYDWNKKTSSATIPGSEFNRNKFALTVGAQF